MKKIFIISNKIYCETEERLIMKKEIYKICTGLMILEMSIIIIIIVTENQ